MNTTERTLGFWSAMASAVLAILWFIPFQMQDIIHPVPQWQDLMLYAAAYSPMRLSFIYPSLLLALTYLVLLSCLYRITPERKKIWALIALSIGILYAVIASINYNIQAVSVRMSLAAGETAGIELFIPDNPNSIFTALSNSYVYMSVSMAVAGFIFGGRRSERWIKILLFIQALSAVGQAGWTMFDLPTGLFIGTSMIWVIGAPVSFILIGLWFRQQTKENT